MPDPRLGDWNRELESDLPDSRLRYADRHKNMVRVGRMEWEQVFCANCGAKGGAVTPEWATHIFYLCNECAHKNGQPPGTIEVDEAALREPFSPEKIALPPKIGS